MSSFHKHCEESVELFGKPYEEVHLWLDEFSEQLGFQHRQKRHHREGIRQVERLFGKDAGQAAKQHIISDLKEWGWTPRTRIPKDEEDFEGMWLLLMLGGRR